MRGEITPKNVLMIGPAGVGKAEIARRLAKLADATFIKVIHTRWLATALGNCSYPSTGRVRKQVRARRYENLGVSHSEIGLVNQRRRLEPICNLAHSA